MTHYQKSISEIINVTDLSVLQEVEDIMRNTIFHSTLDWQSEAQFNKGAKEAYQIYLYLQTSEGKKYMESLLR